MYICYLFSSSNSNASFYFINLFIPISIFFDFCVIDEMISIYEIQPLDELLIADHKTIKITIIKDNRDIE